jgi:hypothetical protein
MSDVVTFFCNDRKKAICPTLTRKIDNDQSGQSVCHRH